MRDYDREHIEEACGDKQGSAEVAVAGEWDVGGDFTINTFCLVLGKYVIFHKTNFEEKFSNLAIYISNLNLV